MGTQGNVSGYAFCFPENEEKSPWESLGVEMGYGPEESTLTMFGGGWAHTGNFLGGTLEDLADGIAGFQWPNGITVLMAPARAWALADKGMSKEDVKDLIWSHAALPMGKFRGGSYYKKFIEPMLRGKPMYEERDLWPKEYLGLKDDEIVPVYPRRHVYVIVVGGDQNPMMQGWKMSNPQTVSIDKWR